MKTLQNKAYFTFFLLLLFGILLLSLIASISLGAVSLPFDEVWKIIINKISPHQVFEPSWKSSTENIVWNLRLPRALLAMITGAGLAICGIMMQALTKNPLSNPHILGISSGASAGAVSIIVLGSVPILGSISISAGAFFGALFTSVLVFILAKQKGSLATTRLILIGVAISALFSSITSFLIFTAHDHSQVRSALFWMTGSLAGAKWEKLLLPTVCLFICYGFIFVFSRGMNSLLLGESVSITLGVDTKFLKNAILFLTSVLTGVLVSITGVIGFVGLIIPHISRTFVGSDHKRVATVSLLLGSTLLMWADVFARIIARPEEIPIGVITSFLGAPFFIWLIRKNSYSFGGKNG